MNVNEFGVDFLMSTGYDMSGFTGLSLVFTKPDATTLTKTDADGITVPAGGVNTTLGAFSGNKYISYTFISGDIDQAGAWTARLTYTEGATIELISEIANFTINP